jgi:hypothetical protein
VSNRVNASGPSRSGSRPAFSISTIVAAGNTASFPVTGDQFYLATSTGSVQIKPSGGTAGGAFVPYYQGTGQVVPGGFNLLEIQNENSFDVVVQVVCSSGDFIDKRLIQNSIAQTNVLVRYSPGNWTLLGMGQYELNLEDQSGKPITDSNGNNWIAISRVLFALQTTSGDAYIQLYPAGTEFFGDPILYVQSDQGSSILPPSEFNASGGFLLLGYPGGAGSTKNLLVYEIYQAIQPGTNQIP